MKNMKSVIDSLEQLENGTAIDKIIEIKSIYKNGKTTVQPVKDPLTGWYRGVERLSDEDKRSKKFWAEPNSKFILKEGTTFDLTREEHRIIWEWVKFQPCLASSFEEAQTRPEAEFYIHIRGQEAQKRVVGKKLKAKAAQLILADNPSNYTLRAKLLSVNMDGEPDNNIILDFLLDMAEKAAPRVIKVYEDKLVSLRMLLINATEKGIVQIEASGAYRYGNIILGMSEDTAIDWLANEENKNTVQLLEKEVNPEYFKAKEKAIIKTKKDSKDLPTLER
jgi:hypothetical protein